MARCAIDEDVRFQSGLRTDPAPLGRGWAPRDRSCVRRERWGQRGFRAGARGGTGCRRSSAHSGPVPLRFVEKGSVPHFYTNRDRQQVRRRLHWKESMGWVGAWEAPRDRSCARREAREGSPMARCAIDEGVRFQSGLRTAPAPLGRGVGSAGPVLRPQGTLGPVGPSRWRARGNRMSTFQCPLRTGPAPLQVPGVSPPFQLPDQAIAGG